VLRRPGAAVEGPNAGADASALLQRDACDRPPLTGFGHFAIHSVNAAYFFDPNRHLLEIANYE